MLNIGGNVRKTSRLIHTKSQDITSRELATIWKSLSFATLHILNQLQKNPHLYLKFGNFYQAFWTHVCGQHIFEEF